MDELKHHGVKGQKWGVVRNSKRPGGADGKWESEKGTDKRTIIRKKMDSMKRERQWKQVIKEMDKMSTKDLQVVKKRVDLENSLKELSKHKVGTKKDKDDYLRRDRMSDQELIRKVARLTAKKNLHKSIRAASEEQRALGIKIAQIGGSLGVKLAVNRKLEFKDLVGAYKKPKEAGDKAMKDGQNLVLDNLGSRFQNQHIKELLESLRQN